MVKNTTGERKIAVLVSKSLDKRAVYRNRTKRIIIEVMQKKLPELNKSYQILIKSRKIFKKEDKKMAEREIEMLFRKAGII